MLGFLQIAEIWDRSMKANWLTDRFHLDSPRRDTNNTTKNEFGSRKKV